MTDTLDALDSMGTVSRPAHSPLGASGADRWLNCPGSYRESLKAPARRASIYAATGTVAHEFIEGVLRKFIEFRAVGLGCPDKFESPFQLDDTRVVEGHAVTVDMEMLDGVDAMVSYVLGRWEEDMEMLVEHHVSLDKYWTSPKEQPPVAMFGRCDVLLRNPFTRTLELVDYKNGSGIAVNPEGNSQLLYYAAGALALPENSTVEHVILTVVQPNTRSQHKSVSWTTTALDVRKWVDDVLKPGVRAVMAQDAPLHMGRWCRFCPALSQCPAHIDAASEAAKTDFAEPGQTFSPPEMARLLDLAENVTRWADAIRERAHEDLRGGDKAIPGWQLVPTRPVRSWDTKGLSAYLAKLDLPITGMQRTQWVSPAQVEKDLTPEAWACLSPFVVSKSSGTKLARSDAAGDFDNLLEQGN